jgi:hypothetical protein
MKKFRQKRNDVLLRQARHGRRSQIDCELEAILEVNFDRLSTGRHSAAGSTANAQSANHRSRGIRLPDTRSLLRSNTGAKAGFANCRYPCGISDARVGVPSASVLSIDVRC